MVSTNNNNNNNTFIRAKIYENIFCGAVKIYSKVESYFDRVCGIVETLSFKKNSLKPF